MVHEETMAFYQSQFNPLTHYLRHGRTPNIRRVEHVVILRTDSSPVLQWLFSGQTALLCSSGYSQDRQLSCAPVVILRTDSSPVLQWLFSGQTALQCSSGYSQDRQLSSAPVVILRTDSSPVLQWLFSGQTALLCYR